MTNLCHPAGCGSCICSVPDEAGYWCHALAVDDETSRLFAWLAAGALDSWRFWLYCRIARLRYSWNERGR